MLHALSHPGVRASQKLVGQRLVWFGMRSDIRTFVQSVLNANKQGRSQKKIEREPNFATFNVTSFT